MVFKVLKNNIVAGAGTNILYIDIPRGAGIQVIAANNGTKANQPLKIDLMTPNNNPNDAIVDNITLLNALQDTTYYAVITYATPLVLGDWRRVVVIFYTADANDQLNMMVGYNE